MALSQEQRQECFATLGRTGGHREVMQTRRVIPEEYEAFLDRVTQEEKTLALPGVDVPVRVVVSIAKEKAEQCPVHINMHGGGFIFKQDHDDDLYCAHIAAAIRGVVVDIDYATSDEHPFPTAFDQCYAVAGWAFSQCAAWGADPAKYSVGGASAGGNLAAALALKATRTGDYRFCLQVLDYAANDNSMPVGDPAQARSEAFSLLYADGDVDLLKDPYVSPAFATDEQLAGLPRTLFIHAGRCPFTAINRKLAGRMVSAGVEVTQVIFAGSNHGFTVRINGEWEKAQETIIRAIRAACL